MFFNGWPDFGGNHDFGVVLCFRLFGLFLGHRLILYGFFDLRGLLSSTIVHGFLESWWFRSFLWC